MLFRSGAYLASASRCITYHLGAYLAPASRCITYHFGTYLAPASRCTTYHFGAYLAPASRCITWHFGAYPSPASHCTTWHSLQAMPCPAQTSGLRQLTKCHSLCSFHSKLVFGGLLFCVNLLFVCQLFSTFLCSYTWYMCSYVTKN